MGIASQRAGLYANLSTLAPEWQVSAYVLSGPTPPTIWLLPATTQYHQAFQNGLEIFDWVVQAFVTFQGGAQELLDLAMEPSGVGSVKAAVESDRKLSGAADDLRVATLDFQGIRTFGTATCLLAEWAVTVYATGAA